MAQGGINGVLNNVAKEDTIEDHIFDTVKGSDYLATRMLLNSLSTVVLN